MESLHKELAKKPQNIHKKDGKLSTTLTADFLGFIEEDDLQWKSVVLGSPVFHLGIYFSLNIQEFVAYKWASTAIIGYLFIRIGNCRSVSISQLLADLSQ